MWHVREEMLRAKTDYVALKDECVVICGSSFDPSTNTTTDVSGNVEYRVSAGSYIGRLQTAKKVP